MPKGRAPRVVNEYVGGSEAATILGVTPRTIYNMLADGRLRGYHLSANKRSPLRIRRSDIEAALVPAGVADDSCHPGGPIVV